MITKLQGWQDMPIQYETGPREEHVQVREAAGLFDIDRMGRLEIEGPGAVEFLQCMQTWDLSYLAVGRAHYSMLLNEAGGIIDDIFVSHRPQSHTRGLEVTIRDRSADTCLVALQGPAARERWKSGGQMWVNRQASSSGNL